MMKINFGDYVREKRQAKRITLRNMADMLHISPAFLSDVEKGRRNPFDENRLEELAGFLKLSPEEKGEMLDLAGQAKNAVAADLSGYIVDRPYVRIALRKALTRDAGEAEWEEMVKALERKKGGV